MGVKAHDTGARILIVNSLQEIHTEKGGASLVKLTVNQAGVEVADVSAVDRFFSILTKVASSLQFDPPASSSSSNAFETSTLSIGIGN